MRGSKGASSGEAPPPVAMPLFLVRAEEKREEDKGVAFSPGSEGGCQASSSPSSSSSRWKGRSGDVRG